jgi:DNA-binding MarR family transcriptional regulator
MTTPTGTDADLGWSLGAVMRAYLRATQLALAQHLGVDRTVMTYLIDDLERAGLVERRPDPADRRARRVLLTEDGRARLCALEQALRQVEDELLAPLEADERAVLRRLLSRLAAGTDAANPCQVAEELDRTPGC